jgi:hypothetical protein
MMADSKGALVGGEFRKRLYEMVSIHTIQSLDLISQPSIIIHRRLPALKHLTTRHLYRSSRNSFKKPINGALDGVMQAPIPAVLDTLCIQSYGSGGGSWDVFDYLADPGNTNILLHSLAELSILCSHVQSWDCALNIMDKCRLSLEVLTVKCYRELSLSLSLFHLRRSNNAFAKFGQSGLPSLVQHLRLEVLAVPNLRTLTVMFPLKTYGRPGSHISWVSSELAFINPPIVTATTLEKVTLFVVLAAADQEFDQEELHELERISETLASQEMFPALNSVQITMGFYEEGSLLLEGIVQQKIRAKPHDPWGAEAHKAFKEATHAIAARRGLDSFEVRWELHRTSPWDWY